MEFVLVHGSGQNAASWSRVAERLRVQGHTATTPELPKQAPDDSLADYAAGIAESVDSIESIVVAHSFSGVFLPLVAAGHGCGLIVFLAAVIPEPGMSVRDQFTADSQMFSPEWIAAGPRWFDKTQYDGLAREFMFHDCDAATLEWGLTTMELYDTRHLATEPSPFTDWPDVPAAAIVAAADRTLTPAWQRRTCERVLGVEPVEIDSGHCPHVSHAHEVADRLMRLARESLQ